MKSKLIAAASTLALIAVSAPATAQMTMPMPSKHAAKKKSAVKKTAKKRPVKRMKQSSARASKMNPTHAGHARAASSNSSMAGTAMPMGHGAKQIPPQSAPTVPGPKSMNQSQVQPGTMSMPVLGTVRGTSAQSMQMSRSQTKQGQMGQMSTPMGGNGGHGMAGTMIRLNQFMVYSHTSGPRGQSRLTGPGMWMLMYDKDLSSLNHLSVDVMGTPEHLTVGSKGTPQLLQTENVDAMHPHDYVMALELRDTLTLGAGNEGKLTFLFAPRGEAAIGPVPFMHRESAEGNPDAPLGHALQDGFHDVSTVMGAKYQIARTTFEATAFSGKNIVWPLPLHSPDSYSVRVNQKIDDHLSVGASYADALLPEDTGGAEHNHFIAAWLSASYLIGHNTLKSSLVWGRGRTARDAPLNSFLEEAVYQQGPNKLFDRAEILQITPAQLDLVVRSVAAVPKWAGALTLGYERTVFEKAGLSLFAGASYTRDFIPGEFVSAYGSDPGGAKLYVRVAFHGGR